MALVGLAFAFVGEVPGATAIGPGFVGLVVGAGMVIAAAILRSPDGTSQSMRVTTAEGKQLLYDEKGRLRRVEVWADGVLQSATDYDEHARPMKPQPAAES